MIKIQFFFINEIHIIIFINDEIISSKSMSFKYLELKIDSSCIKTYKYGVDNYHGMELKDGEYH